MTDFLIFSFVCMHFFLFNFSVSNYIIFKYSFYFYLSGRAQTQPEIIQIKIFIGTHCGFTVLFSSLKYYLIIRFSMPCTKWHEYLYRVHYNQIFNREKYVRTSWSKNIYRENLNSIYIYIMYIIIRTKMKGLQDEAAMLTHN